MNPRILKKLCKKSAILIEALGLNKGLEKVVSDGGDDIETHVRVDRKHLDRFRGKVNTYGRFTQLNGTIGYGCTSGYYEPEWDDTDAYTFLRRWVVDSFTDYENVDKVTDWPINNCPRSVRVNPLGIFNFSRIEIGKAKQRKESK